MLLGKLALGYLGVEALDALVIRRRLRRIYYRTALQKAAELGKPLLVVGKPKAGFINNVVGFQRYTGLTENVQQGGDWVLRLPSGVRLHAHEFSNGRWTVHLDKFDPDHSLLYAVMHIASETSAARFAAYCTAIYFGYRWWVA